MNERPCRTAEVVCAEAVDGQLELSEDALSTLLLVRLLLNRANLEGKFVDLFLGAAQEDKVRMVWLSVFQEALKIE